MWDSRDVVQSVRVKCARLGRLRRQLSSEPACLLFTMLPSPLSSSRVRIKCCRVVSRSGEKLVEFLGANNRDELPPPLLNTTSPDLSFKTSLVPTATQFRCRDHCRKFIAIPGTALPLWAGSLPCWDGDWSRCKDEREVTGARGVAGVELDAG